MIDALIEAGRARPADPAAQRAADIAAGREVLRIEAQALAQLEGALGDSFADAVQAMIDCKGRIVVSGMGKSGHVARKIAATLASTGTPAQFLHPAEASHGDLGMLTRQDVALVLSNSGGTPELADVIAHTRRFGIPLIGVASRPESPLLRAADIALVLPRAPEACSVGMAPTTSTTLTMALGDALAVALMKRRRFTAEHFRLFHPGGKLGAQLVHVRDLMHPEDELPLVAEDAPMTETLLEITRRGFGVAGVVDAAGDLVGVISDGDLRRNMEGLLARVAGQVATRAPATIAPDRLAQEALALMNQRKVTALFVVDPAQGRRPLGLLHVHDCLRAGLDQV
ncbi:arabinose-5-phosphate isomerase [Oceanicella actignis]|uniref:Arabinose-5-phosphate isomerase n=1 Tax=Oceanicella actignis TaxID=1189325 RepID=A0A1M7TE35_9RHOB|nr:arabinose-5-phosphate isomerase [Oceanicella actignis]SHN68985.1 arabinose-5-phosphate isomerase [Oceanicella actignis]